MVRLDREGMYTIPIWVGLFISGLYVLVMPQIEFGVTNTEENVLAFFFMLGASICLYGVWINDRHRAYKVEICGLALIIVVLGILAAFTKLPLVEQFTMAGGLGALVQIGSIRMIVQLALALHRDYEDAHAGKLYGKQHPRPSETPTATKESK